MMRPLPPRNRRRRDDLRSVVVGVAAVVVRANEGLDFNRSRDVITEVASKRPISSSLDQQGPPVVKE